MTHQCNASIAMFMRYCCDRGRDTEISDRGDLIRSKLSPHASMLADAAA